jgi:predicted nucleic acid-binding protein
VKILLDTNILLRLSERDNPHHTPAVASLRLLAMDGHTFCIGSQTIAEFLAVATRSIADRGLGMSQTVADAELSKVTSELEVLYDSADVIAELRKLVVAYAVTGKSVHDTRLVATMNTYGIPAILTFNRADFARFTGINVIDPAAVTRLGPGNSP